MSLRIFFFVFIFFSHKMWHTRQRALGQRRCRSCRQPPYCWWPPSIPRNALHVKKKKVCVCVQECVCNTYRGLVLRTTVRRLSFFLSLSLSQVFSLWNSHFLFSLSLCLSFSLARALSLSPFLSLSQNPVWTLTWYFNALHNIGFSSTARVRGRVVIDLLWQNQQQSCCCKWGSIFCARVRRRRISICKEGFAWRQTYKYILQTILIPSLSVCVCVSLSLFSLCVFWRGTKKERKPEPRLQLLLITLLTEHTLDRSRVFLFPPCSSSTSKTNTILSKCYCAIVFVVCLFACVIVGLFTAVAPITALLLLLAASFLFLVLLPVTTDWFSFFFVLCFFFFLSLLSFTQVWTSSLACWLVPVVGVLYPFGCRQLFFETLNSAAFFCPLCVSASFPSVCPFLVFCFFRKSSHSVRQLSVRVWRSADRDRPSSSSRSCSFVDRQLSFFQGGCRAFVCLFVGFFLFSFWGFWNLSFVFVCLFVRFSSFVAIDFWTHQ